MGFALLDVAAKIVIMRKLRYCKMSLNWKNADVERCADNSLITLTNGLKRCDTILAAAEDDPRGADLARLCSRIYRLKRALFLSELEKFLSDFTKAEVAVLCSEGKSAKDGGRRVEISGSSKEGVGGSERLMINISGLDSGALIPLISLTDGHPALEGIINVSSDRGEVGGGPVLDFLSLAAPLIAQWFSNLKAFTSYAGVRRDEMRGADKSVPARRREITERYVMKLIDKLPGMDADVDNEAGRGKRRHPVVRRIFMTVVVLAIMMMGSAFGSYDKVPVLRAPFNVSASYLGEWLGGFPREAVSDALDDGLLRVWITSDSAQEVHDWLKGDNPAGVDYEAVLKKHGWSDKRVHVIGRLLGMVPR